MRSTPAATLRWVVASIFTLRVKQGKKLSQKSQNLMSTWMQIERYARFRGRMHLDRLPCDILHYIATAFLGEDDAMRLSEAFAGRMTSWSLQPYPVPPSLSSVWRNALGGMRLHDVAYSIADDAFWYASIFKRAHLHVDWSPFSERGFRPIANYRWCDEKPHAKIAIDDDAIRQCVRRALERSSTCVCVSLYAYASHVSRNALKYRPMKTFNFEIVPPGAFRTPSN